MPDAPPFETVGGFSLAGVGLTFAAVEGLPAGARGDDGDDPFEAACAAVRELAEGDPGGSGEVTLAATVTITDLDVEPIGTRGAGGDPPALHITPPDDRPPGTAYLALVEEDGVARWVAEDEDQVLVLPAATAPTEDRGLVGAVVRRVVRVLAVKGADVLMEGVGASLVARWDRARISAPEGEGRHGGVLRCWTRDDHRSASAAPVDVGPPDDGRSAPAAALLVVHGFTGSTHRTFTFEDDVVAGLGRAYGDLTMAYDHPTVVSTPAENARDLLDRLHAQVRRPVQLDVLAHSRGGLVARELARLVAEEADETVAVRSITFVATPNAGTPLADPERPQGLLDAVTTVAGLAGDAAELAVALAQDVLIRGVAPHLRGWMAMDPSSPRLAALNDDPPPAGVLLRAIAADHEPRTDAGFARKARDTAIDLYFGSVRNDLIVPTRSTIETDRAFRVDVGRRLVLDSSRGIDHSTFWRNQRVVDQLLRWFGPDPADRDALVPFADSDPHAAIAEMPPTLGVRALDTIRRLPANVQKGIGGLLGGPVDPGSTPVKGGRKAAVVIPGIMGTHLARPDGSTVWIDSSRLALGAFRELELPLPGQPVEPHPLHPAGINQVYLPLVSRLAVDHDVHLFGFDWRRSVVDGARELAVFIREHVLDAAGDHPVHLVAHSMGGLVARALALTDAPGHEPGSLWAELGRDRGQGGGRLVMMGTPNRGSHVIPLVLTGDEALAKALAFVDVTADKESIARVIATMPGVYEMLPAHGAGIEEDRSDDLYEAAAWGSWPDGWPRAHQDLLDAATRVQADLAAVPIEGDRMVSIAGSRVMTPFRLAALDRAGGFSIGQHLYGDGRVSHALGRLDPVPMHYVEASHGSIPSHPAVLAAIAPLLARQAHDLPPVMAPLRSKAEAPGGVVVPAAEVDPDPALARGGQAPPSRARHAAVIAEGSRLLLGGGTVVASRPRTTLRVTVVNGSLEMARHPVAVGHYSSLPMGGAEAFLDGALGGLLAGRQRLGGYPQAAGAGRHYEAGPDSSPPGALVLGLGDYSTLSRATLAEAMASAVADMLANARRPAAAAVPQVGVSAVLVGTPGRRGLDVDEAVAALTQGTVDGVERHRVATGTTVGVVELEIVERHAQTADEAARAVARLGTTLPGRVRQVVDLRPDPFVQPRAGRVPGAPSTGSSGRPWVKVEARLLPPRDGVSDQEVEFSLPSHGAQSLAVTHPIERRLTETMVADAVQGAATGEITSALFAHLLPHDLKLDLDHRESVHLVVDRELAKVPWELVGGAAGRPEDSFALRAGFLRQLQGVVPTRPGSRSPEGARALVIGDPPTELRRLPGARTEARRVAELFRRHRYRVDDDLVFDAGDTPSTSVWTGIATALTRERWRVVHIAAHGVMDDAAGQAGVVVGPTIAERLTATTFQKMEVAPDLVFLNCCHLGHLGALGPVPPGLDRPNDLAATLAETLMGIGVRAVVVAGWAVDDEAALVFAETLYRALFAGEPLGDATLQARNAAQAVDAAGQTWGAYQVYGSPDFELPAHEAGDVAPTVVSADDVVLQLQELTAQAGQTSLSDEEVAARIEAVAEAASRTVLVIPPREGAPPVGADLDGRVCAALGEARAAVHDLAGAISAHRAALGARRGSPDIRTAEQLANHCSRHGAALAREGLPGGDELATEARRLIDGVIALAGPTVERTSLLAGVAKRQAVATDDPEERRQLMRKARRLYAQFARRDGGSFDLYPANNWVQLDGLLAATSASGAATRRRRAVAIHAQADALAPAGYFEVAARGDALLTCLVVGALVDGERVTVDDVVDAYRRAFDLRSQRRQRRSAIDHVRDLLALADGAPCEPDLRDLVALLDGPAGA